MAGKTIEEGGTGTTLPEGIVVLLVEPQKFQSDILRTALTGAGVPGDNITQARDVTSALEILKNLTPDVVITELDFVDAPGEYLVRAIRDRRIKAPILAVTSMGDAARVREAVSAGVTDYILKPVSNAMITKRVARHLRQSGWA